MNPSCWERGIRIEEKALIKILIIKSQGLHIDFKRRK